MTAPTEAPRTPTRTGLRARAVRAADGVWTVVDVLVGRRAPWGEHRHAVLTSWLLTRLLMLAVLVGIESTIVNDVRYYAAGLAEIGPASPVASVLREYPTPVVGLLALPWLLSFGSIDAYVVLFVAAMLALDATFTWLLGRGPGTTRTRRDAQTLWCALGPALGPLLLTRFDLLPAVLAGVAVLGVLRRPGWSGAAVTLGAATKLWPALLLPTVMAPRTGRWRALGGAALTGAVLVAGSVAVAGWGRLLSPLSYQTDRGLQVESVAALPLMLAWALVHEPWEVVFSRFITSEIHGPGADVLVAAATLASLAAVAVTAVLWVRAWRVGGHLGAAPVGWVVLVTTSLFILTNKVFSPQYVIWLAPTAAVLLAVSARKDLGARRYGALLCVVALVTQVIYPRAYLLVTEESWGNLFGVALLAVRDLLLVAITGYALWRAWRGTRPVSPR